MASPAPPVREETMRPRSSHRAFSRESSDSDSSSKAWRDEQLGGGESPEEELAALRKKFALLEGDRRAAIETSQWTVKQNRELLVQLKRENKQLARQLRADGVGPEDAAPRSLVEKQTEDLEKEVHSLRRKHDTLVQERQEAARRLERVLDDIKELQANASSIVGSTPEAREIRLLENRLDKATVKHNEAVSIRKTYEQMNEVIKDDIHNLKKQLEGVQDSLAAKQNDLDQMRALSVEAAHSRDSARHDLSNAEQQLREDRGRRERALQDNDIQLRGVQASNARLLELSQSHATALAALRASTAAFAGSDYASDDDGPTSKRAVDAAMASAWEALKSALRVTSPEELVDKYTTQVETTTNLKQLREQAVAQLASLEAQADALQKKIDDLTLNRKAVNGARNEVELAEGRLKEGNSKMYASKDKCEAVTQKIGFFTTGLTALSNALAHLPTSDRAPPVEVTPRNLLEVLRQLEDRLINAQATVSYTDGDVLGEIPESRVASFRRSASDALRESILRREGSSSLPAGGDASGSGVGDDDERPDAELQEAGIYEDEAAGSSSDSEDGMEVGDTVVDRTAMKAGVRPASASQARGRARPLSAALTSTGRK